MEFSKEDNELNIEEQIPSGIVTGISFNIVTQKLAEKICTKIIGASNQLKDPELGLPNLENVCRTCGAKDVKACEGHFGLIKLPYTVLHPYFLPEVAKILNRICPGCKSILRDKIKGSRRKSREGQPWNCKYCNGCWKDRYPTMTFKVSSVDLFGRTAIIAEANESLSKKAQNRGGMAQDYWDIIPKDPQQDQTTLRTDKRILSHAQVYHILKDVDPKFLQEYVRRENNTFINCWPVTPNCLRVSEFAQHMIFESGARVYRPLIDFKGTANELSVHIVDCLKMSKICVEKPSMETIYKHANDESAPKNNSGLKFIKDLVLGKRTDHAFRMVVVGDPSIHLGEIGIPCHVAEALEVFENLNSFNHEKLSISFALRILEKGSVHVRRNNKLVRLGITDKLQAGDSVFRQLTDGDVVLINRPPSIHPHSLIALSVKILPTNSVLSVNPLICSPLRGDFDGDCLHGYVPQSIESRIELRELVALDKQLINGQSGQNLLSISHDSLTSAHLLLKDGVVLPLHQFQQLQMFSPRKLQSPETMSSESCLWTGKQLFSLLLPLDLNYELPSKGIEIRNGELISSSIGSSWLRDADENLFYNLMKHSHSGFLDILQDIQRLLCEWLSMRGLSVSLYDLYLSRDSYKRENMMEQVSLGLKAVEGASLLKLLLVDSDKNFEIEDFNERESIQSEQISYECQKSAALSRAYVSMCKHMFRDIENLFYNYADEDNSFLTMLKAGSKGNLLKVVQHCMSLGLQNSLTPLPFKLPHKLSCTTWNKQKASNSHDETGPYISYSVIENSFLTGLNPLECFVHSLTTRDNSFGGHADISGSLTRRLMFFMRDLYIGYDGTVRNPYGNQVVQFSYDTDDNSYHSNDDENGSKPVGSFAACALSEVAYSALDQPFSALDSSPLLNLKKVLECGVKKKSGDKTASLFFSKNLGRWTFGNEYGALEVKRHLERVLFWEIVSTVMIYFTPRTNGETKLSPWVCHFYIQKEIAEKKLVRVKSIIKALKAKCSSDRGKSKTNFPQFEITSMDSDVENKAKICITVATVSTITNSNEELDHVRDTVIPFFLGIVIKGSSNVEKVDILWKDNPYASRTRRGQGELYLRVLMSKTCNRDAFWRLLKDDCLPIMGLIDWERSHPDDINDLALENGIDAAWAIFLTRLKSAVSDTGKTVLEEHLILAADSLSFTGEFVGLTAKGLAEQRKHTSVSSPFMQACFSNPRDAFIKAAKMESNDNLQGSLDALSWGNVPSFGTAGNFEILYSGKGHKLDKPEDIYSLLGSHNDTNCNVNVKMLNEKFSSKQLAKSISTHKIFEGKGLTHIDISKEIRSKITANDIRRLSLGLKNILHKYKINDELSQTERNIVMMALHFHPKKYEKIGIGADTIKVGNHPKWDSKCFMLVRTDGTEEDFSYHKCVYHAMEFVDPKRAEAYKSKWLNRKD